MMIWNFSYSDVENGHKPHIETHKGRDKSDTRVTDNWLERKNYDAHVKVEKKCHLNKETIGKRNEILQ